MVSDCCGPSKKHAYSLLGWARRLQPFDNIKSTIRTTYPPSRYHGIGCVIWKFRHVRMEIGAFWILIYRWEIHAMHLHMDIDVPKNFLFIVRHNDAFRVRGRFSKRASVLRAHHWLCIILCVTGNWLCVLCFPPWKIVRHHGTFLGHVTKFLLGS